VESRIVPSSERIAAAPWPVPWGATRRPSSRAKLTTSTTSESVRAIATAAGR
jgi:hypothetical protein